MTIKWKDGKVERKAIQIFGDGGVLVQPRNSASDLADALDEAVAALQKIAGCHYIYATGCPHEASETLRRLGVEP